MRRDSRDRWPESIRNTWLRRAALLVVFPAVAVWVMPSILIMPFIVAARVVAAAWDAARWELDGNWNGDNAQLLRIGFGWIWHAKYHDDRDAALAEVQRKVRGR